MVKARLHEVDLLRNTVEYNVRRSAEATEPRIDVDIHGVTIFLPDDADISPETLLKENAAWVVDKQRNYDKHREQIPDRAFEAAEEFPYLGEDRVLVIEPCQQHAVDEERIRLRQSTVEQSSVKQVLENVYRRQARKHFIERLDLYADQMGVEYEKLELRNQRTRWGAARPVGR